MVLVLPTEAELREELDDAGSSMRAQGRDSKWCVKLKDDDHVEPADVHGV